MKTALTFVVLLMWSLLSFAQNQVFNPNLNTLGGNKITSVIESTSHASSPIAVGDRPADAGQPKASSGPVKNVKATWETVVEKTSDNGFTVSKKLKRIQLAVDGPVGLEKYDSDNTFESTDGTQNWVKSYVDVLDKKSTHTVPATGEATAINKTDKVWNNDLPVYESSFYWNGLILNPPASIKIEKDAHWNEVVELNDRTIQTEFIVANINGNSFSISIKSTELYKKQNNQLNAQGAPDGLMLGLKKRQKTFEGALQIDAKSMLILNGTFKTETISDLSVNGDTSESKTYSTITITNTIEK
ncbi:hypothetical protein JN11_01592 [Mucilaginibacter frigoritolerans]|uniref:Uncharacterized protein n=1 Tax=Mucilaginibacter frigoritolerans TaxID=652788 RepID=A0A562U8F2_9SPHI|nr:hypothetical protein [Mucilaginibacter frigoritolerans]TWJ01441.1 hypothetical protein JN11_01592 [Mucilaginibacter frigoritolerans]